MIRQKTILYEEPNYYNGIFKYLSNETKVENLLSSGVIEFSVLHESQHEDHSDYGFILGYNNTNHKNYYITGTTGPEQWFQVDFKMNRIIPYGYFYRAHWKDFYDRFELIGSYNLNDWFVLDSRNNTEFEGYGDTNITLIDMYFECNQPIYKPFRYLRIQPYGNRTYKGYGIAIFGLEFYGIIKPYTHNTAAIPINNIRIFHFSIALFSLS